MMADLRHPRGGELLTAVSNAMVAMHREHFGRGPSRVKTFAFDGMMMCVLHDVFTTVEKTLIQVGKAEHVRQTRLLHQHAVSRQYKRVIHELTGRDVVGFSSSVNFDPDLAFEIFMLGGEAVEGNGPRSGESDGAT
jgi:uncharacterized protein YbcI